MRAHMLARVILAALCVATSGSLSVADTHYVSAANSIPVAPYTNWTNAATNIQDAVDAADPGDTVLVTNGVYDAGGAITPSGSGMNRVVIMYDIAVQSVNGPEVTSIVGASDGGTNGPAAVRGIYMQTGTLCGFTISNGHTKASGLFTLDRSGGGINMYGGSATVSNCVLVANSADSQGGGVYYGTLNDCTLSGNSADNGGGSYDSVLTNCTFFGNMAKYNGGGSHDGTLYNCILSGNVAYGEGGADGGGSYGGTLSNCRLLGNSAIFGGGSSHAQLYSCMLAGNSASYGGGDWQSVLINCTLTGNTAYRSGGGSWRGEFISGCIVWYNTARDDGDDLHEASFVSGTCSPDAAHGTYGNITNAPLLISSSHIATNSPCRGAASTGISGTDIDGEAWLDPPSMGCDENYGCGNVTGDVSAVLLGPVALAENHPAEYTPVFTGPITGTVVDFGNGLVRSNHLGAIETSWPSAGMVQVLMTAYNDDHPGGITFTQNIDVLSVTATCIYVSIVTGSDTNDGSSWETAKQTIQAGVDAQHLYGGVVWVSNGIYNAGSVITPSYTSRNRVAITREMVVRSVHGAEHTYVVGASGGGTNDAETVRGVYMTAGTLSGFTVTNGHTLTVGDALYDRGGGGVLIPYGKGTISDCTLIGSSAHGSGGGAFLGRHGTANNCTIIGNVAGNVGGGISSGTVNNCPIIGNVADRGGGASLSTLNNCTISGNTADEGGGTYGGSATNSIVWYNTAASLGNDMSYVATTIHSCSPDLPHGASGNITNAPVFMNKDGEDFRLQTNSLCINTGTNLPWIAGATDLEGNPRVLGGTVDMGAYEYAGMASVDITNANETVSYLQETYTVRGTNNSFTTGSLWWTNTANGSSGSLPVSGSAFEIADIALESFTNLISVYGTNHAGDVAQDSVTITRSPEHGGDFPVHYVSTNGAAIWPYTNWTTAAVVIQDAITAASSNDTVWVGDGVYGMGGKVVNAISNRVALTKAIMLRSVAGPASTFIVGAADPDTTSNGAFATRCAYVSNGATLVGFTLTNGHTKISGDPLLELSGGGAWLGAGGEVSNCTFRGNAAKWAGGGAACYYGGIIHDCIAEENTADNAGGIYLFHGGVASRCTIRSNRVYQHGGGVFINSGGILRSCLIVDNSADLTGGGAFCYYGGALDSCTMTANTAAPSGGGGMRCHNGGTLNNCIVWNNPDGGNVYDGISGTWMNCCTTPSIGTSPITNDPLFVAVGDYRLQPTSPCINTGTNLPWMVGATDLDGNPRIADAVADIGAYEYVAPGFAPVAVTLPATAMLNDAATLNGTVNPGLLTTMAWFEWGGSPSAYAFTTVAGNVGSGPNPVVVDMAVSNLTPGVTFHFRCVASNSLGVSYGEDETFWIPDLVLNGSDILTNQLHQPFVDPGAEVAGAVQALDAGWSHSLALKGDGTVAVWGTNNYNQLDVPPDATGVVAVAAGYDHNLAVRADGTVVGWGLNDDGQVTIPPGVTGIVSVAGAGTHSLALREDGAVLAWGDPGSGRLNVPAEATNVVAISGGGAHSLALREDSTVLAWGWDGYGQSTVPSNLVDVVGVAAGRYHSLALLADGTVQGWGYDNVGQASPPAYVSNLVAIAAGGYHGLGLRPDGRVIAWGSDSSGQATVPPGATNNVVAIAAGTYHSLALRAEGAIVAWGRNEGGQTNVPSSLQDLALPVAVSGTVDVNTPGIYELTYSVTNDLGAVATAVRTVHVVGTAAEPAVLGEVQLGLSGGLFTFSVEGPSGQVVVIEATTNLPAAGGWDPIQTNTLGAGPLIITDPESVSQPQRSYRGISP